MYPVVDQIYGPILREKGGELQAAMDLHPPMKAYMLPTWVALPLSAKENAASSVTDVMKREVGRVQRAWGNNVCLWDPRFLQFDSDLDEDGKNLEHLLEQFAVFGCRVIPVASLREGFARLSVMAAHSRATGSGLAVRVEFNDIGDFEVLEALLKSVRVEPQNCVLLIDLTDADISEHDEFARFLVDAIDNLGVRGNWARIVAAASSYPFKNPAEPDNEAAPERAEWKVWEWALQLNPTLHVSAIYGDFGADNAQFNFEGGGIPIPHLRYALRDSWRVVRGGSTFASFRSVARRIAESPTFMGRAFSVADEFIADCAAGGSIGDATAWRTANMNHHFTATLTALAERYPVAFKPREARQGQQISIFDSEDVAR